MNKTFVFDQPAYETVTDKEWLVTNGLGGFASSSICGANTRRYHGVLVAALDPPGDRKVLVSKIEEKIIAAKEEFFPSTNAYPGTIHPKGYQHLRSFTRMPIPTVTFAKGNLRFSKSIFMRDGMNTSVVSYANESDEALLFELTPLLAYRDYHHLFHEDHRWNFRVNMLDERFLEITPAEGIPPYYFRFTAGIFYEQPDWYRHFQYAREEERGLDFSEDAASIGKVSCMLAPGETTFLVFGTNLSEVSGDPLVWQAEEIRRVQALSAGEKDSFCADLMTSGDQFVVHRKGIDSKSVIAGYPWFADWGRDTMIAMRGLVIATGKKKLAKSIFRTFLSYLDRGMIPNRFPDQGTAPEYNTIDATLWMFVALYEYYEEFKDRKFIKEVFDALMEILDEHMKGTRYAIHITEEGILYGGVPGVQLTWMDAKVGDHIVTPRQGCPVEINALWYNALSIYVYFGRLLKRDVRSYAMQAKRFPKIFQQWFLNDEGYLHDVVSPGQPPDDAIRPNMLYAVSLPFSPLTKAMRKKVLEVVTAHLYTDYGLRSLSPEHPAYQPIFTGDPWQRDNAYHQGTVWSFLWGEYALAYMKVHQDSPESTQWVQQHVQALKDHFYDHAGLYCISENFDGDHPLEGKGCIHQAWSIGMTLLALKRAKA